MYHSSRNSLGTAFTLGVGAGILIHTVIKKLPSLLNSTEYLQVPKSDLYKTLKQKVQELKEFSSGLIANPIPDLYKATDSLTLNEEDLIHATE